MKNTNCLTNLKCNEQACIKEIDRCCNAKRRLYELGLHKGAKVKMVKNDKGPVVLNISGNKIALGRGIANNIIVE